MKREQPAKLPFLNVCATCNFTPVGLANMAGVSKWVVYAMLDQQPVTRDHALKVLAILNEFNLRKEITYTLDNVDIVIAGEDTAGPGDTSTVQIV
jgi:hypothetical protein